MNKRLILLSILTSLLLITPALALSVNEIIGTIGDIGSLTWLLGGSADNQLIGFIRIAIAVLVFALLYAGCMALHAYIPRNIGITISIILALISAIGMPASVLQMFMETYSVIFAFIIIGAPIAGIMALLFLTPTPNTGTAVIKFFAVCFLIWLIYGIQRWAIALTGATGRI